jgi:hypothetical protein
VAYDSANVRVLSTVGRLYRAVTGTTAPTNAATALNAAFIDLGGWGEDGLSEERERDTEQIRYAWGELAREVVTESAYTIKVPLIETTQATLEAFYGAAGTVASTELQVTIDPSQTGGRFAWVWEAVDGAYLRRTYIPSGEVTEVDEHTVTVDEPWAYTLTIQGYRDATAGFTARSWWAGLDLA